MRHTPWIKHQIPKEKPYLILGKGPSLERVFEQPELLDEYHTIALNHAGILFADKVDYVHFVDMDVPYGFKDQIPNVKKWICPWHPHVNFKASIFPLTNYQVSNTKKSTFYWYNSSKSRIHNAPKDPVIKLHYTSAESVFQLLYHQGIKEVHSVGIEGGKEYHKTMLEIGLKPLTCGQISFDRGFFQLDKICKYLNIKWKKL